MGFNAGLYCFLKFTLTIYQYKFYDGKVGKFTTLNPKLVFEGNQKNDYFEHISTLLATWPNVEGQIAMFGKYYGHFKDLCRHMKLNWTQCNTSSPIKNIWNNMLQIGLIAWTTTDQVMFYLCNSGLWWTLWTSLLRHKTEYSSYSSSKIICSTICTKFDFLLWWTCRVPQWQRWTIRGTPFLEWPEVPFKSLAGTRWEYCSGVCIR